MKCTKLGAAYWRGSADNESLQVTTHGTALAWALALWLGRWFSGWQRHSLFVCWLGWLPSRRNRCVTVFRGRVSDISFLVQIARCGLPFTVILRCLSSPHLSRQRVYGISFPDKKQLKAWELKMEEAKKRDHRLIGNKQVRKESESLVASCGSFGAFGRVNFFHRQHAEPTPGRFDVHHLEINDNESD